MRADADERAGRFPTTHWSEVARAGAADPRVRREALGRLLAAYLPACRAHLVRHKRIPADRADDLLQGFVCDQVVADGLIARADRERGRLRSFVAVALDRYVAAVRRAENAAKRKPDKPILDFERGEPRSGGKADAADAFDLAWAREVVSRAVGEMRGRCAGGRGHVWVVFEACALRPIFEGVGPPPHDELARELGLGSAQQVSNTLVTAKRTFARVLRSVVGEYATGGDIDAELKELWAILARAGTAANGRQ